VAHPQFLQEGHKLYSPGEAAHPPSGNLILGEAKNGPTAALNPNQQRVFQALKNEGGRLVGGNARNAGLPATVRPGEVRVFKY